MLFAPNGFGKFLGFTVLQFVLVGGNSLHLAWRLVFGQVELFFNLVLSADQMLITLFVLELGADFRFQFLRSFVCIGDVGFQPGGALLEALDRGFE